MTVSVRLRGVQKSFGAKRVLDGVDLAVEPQEVFALVGPSGAGKTTLLRIVAGLDGPDAGEVVVDGTANPRSSGLGREVGLVMQRPAVFRRTVFDNVAYGLHLQGLPEEEIDRRVSAALDRVGLRDARDAKAWTLSAGEAQRVCFARAAVLRPKLLLLDEFTANLDPANVSLLEGAVTAYHRETQATIVIVTHNLFQAKRVARRAGLLLGGKLVETADVETFFTNPRNERTRAFVRGEMPY
ncbi:MAG: phosphate ABC transporter ATP-binding protein [Euryarchaeota archaeon]|nr:phosphate ABC transporter ATP-binding protein [Euryarchaeota archaeon]